jgi:hypothetical protein
MRVLRPEDRPVDITPHRYCNWKRTSGGYQWSSRDPLPAKKTKKRWHELRPGMDDTHRLLCKTLPSCVSGLRTQIDPHHLMGGPASATRSFGVRSTDRWIVPVTREEHNDLDGPHGRGGPYREFSWFLTEGVNPYAYACGLWLVTGCRERMESVAFRHGMLAIDARIHMRANGVKRITEGQVRAYLDATCLSCVDVMARDVVEFVLSQR